MSESNPLTSSRPTLKLKVAARKPPEETLTVSGATLSPSLPHPVASTPPPRPQSKLIKKPGAAWSDELKHRMQEDMDALLTR